MSPRAKAKGFKSGKNLYKPDWHVKQKSKAKAEADRVRKLGYKAQVRKSGKWWVVYRTHS